MIHLPVHRALDVAASQERQCITGIDSQCSILRLNPFPLVMNGVANLKGCYGLAEEKGE